MDRLETHPFRRPAEGRRPAKIEFLSGQTTCTGMFSRALLIAAAAAVFLAVGIQRSKKKKSIPPKTTAGFFESVRRLTSPESPWFLLEQARIVGPVFRVHLCSFKGSFHA